MRRRRGWVAAAFVAALIASGCDGADATPTASSTAGQTPTPAAVASASASASQTAAVTASPTAPATPTASPPPELSGFYVRSWTVAPIGPVNSFGSAPRVISDGLLLAVKYPPPADPSPLYATPVRRTINEAGLITITAEAQNLGLLGTATSFVCPHAADAGMLAGSGTDHLVLIVKGVTHQLTASCPYQQPTPGAGPPAPATWAAFQRFKTILSDPSAVLGANVSSEAAYDPEELAVLAMAFDNSAGSPNPANVVQWPLLAPFTMFGVGAFGARCAVVEGSDAAALLPVVKAAYVTTLFRDRTGAFAKVVVRAFMPGEPDPCAGG